MDNQSLTNELKSKVEESIGLMLENKNKDCEIQRLITKIKLEVELEEKNNCWRLTKR